jgi:hypothetical protein
MASTYSDLKIQLMATGENSGTWGTVTNANLGTALEEAIVGRATANFTSDANLTLTLTDTNATQVARNFVLNVTSGVSLTTTRDLIVPAIEKPYLVQNNTTGGQSIRVIVAGTSVTIPNGKTAFIYNNGTNISMASDYFVAPTFSSFTSTGDGTFSGTGQIKVPAGATGDRSGSPVNGMFRYNSSLNQFEGYAAGVWGSIGGGGQAGGAITINETTASSSYTIASGENGLSVGPITVASGVTITVSSGQRWLIL